MYECVDVLWEAEKWLGLVGLLKDALRLGHVFFSPNTCKNKQKSSLLGSKRTPDPGFPQPPFARRWLRCGTVADPLHNNPASSRTGGWGFGYFGVSLVDFFDRKKNTCSMGLAFWGDFLQVSKCLCSMFLMMIL